MVLIRKFVERKKKNKSQTQIRFSFTKVFGRRRRIKREELVDSCNHQSKVRVGLKFSNLRLCDSETEFNM